MTGIHEAVAIAGGQAKMGEAMGVTQQTISTWVRKGWVPMRWVVPVEQLTGIHRSRLINPKLVDLVSAPFGD